MVTTLSVSWARRVELAATTLYMSWVLLRLCRDHHTLDVVVTTLTMSWLEPHDQSYAPPFRDTLLLTLTTTTHSTFRHTSDVPAAACTQQSTCVHAVHYTMQDDDKKEIPVSTHRCARWYTEVTMVQAISMIQMLLLLRHYCSVSDVSYCLIQNCHHTADTYAYPTTYYDTLLALLPLPLRMPPLLLCLSCSVAAVTVAAVTTA